MIQTNNTIEIVFGLVGGVLLVLLVMLVANRKNEKRRKNLILAFCSTLFLSFCWAWFVPVEVGRKGEFSVCKFRFQVFEYDLHAYNGDGDWNDWLFLYHYDNSHSKYGSIDFHNSIGGTWEYFGLKEVEQ